MAVELRSVNTNALERILLLRWQSDERGAIHVHLRVNFRFCPHHYIYISCAMSWFFLSRILIKDSQNEDSEREESVRGRLFS